jgi:hypothetical protein
MDTHADRAGHYTVDDGLGVRWIEADAAQGWLEVLEVAPALASHPAVEKEMRARAELYSGVAAGALAPVRRIERKGEALRSVAVLPDGIRLSDLLADLEFGNEVLNEAAMLELAATVIRAVAAVHEIPGGVAHGAVNPAHILLTWDGAAVLTDGQFGGALETLQKNREQLWREFGLALPASASLPRFDQRADVTQLGAVVLAITLRRQLRANEYPRGVGDLVIAATPDDAHSHSSALRMWLQQALQLHPRAVFGSAVGARLIFKEIVASAGFARAGVLALRTLIQKRFSKLRAS